jgi:hypothetical protein
VWWHTAVILALEKLREQNSEFKVSLAYISRSRSAWAAQRDSGSKEFLIRRERDEPIRLNSLCCVLCCTAHSIYKVLRQ